MRYVTGNDRSCDMQVLTAAGNLQATDIKGCQTDPAAEQRDAELPTFRSSRMLFTLALPCGLHRHRGHHYLDRAKLCTGVTWLSSSRQAVGRTAAHGTTSRLSPQSAIDVKCSKQQPM